jgi:methylated-DNA-[protein]-cysteine S-methyltransferase
MQLGFQDAICFGRRWYQRPEERKDELMKALQVDSLDSPIGTIVLVVDGGQLCSLDFGDYHQRMMTLLERRYGPVSLTTTVDPCGFSSRMRAYFAGDYHALDTIPVSTGGTAFQQNVWQSLRTIPPGITLTYGQLATKIGKPTAYRAVGGTNALNPVAIVLPCHRVVGANASLTGYAGGLERKQWLLHHEGCDVLRQQRMSCIRGDHA